MDDRVPSRDQGGIWSAVAGRRTSAVLVITALLLGGVLPLAGLGQEAAPAEKPTVKPRPAPGNVAKGLARAAKLEFKETPLQDALDSISARYRVEIILCKRALAEEHIAPDKPVTERIHSMKLDKALDVFFQHLHLAYAVCDNAIVVTTAKQAEAGLVTRVYPLSMPRGGGRAGNPRATNAFLTEVQQTLRRKVAPKSWDEVGGPGSACTLWLGSTGALVVSQTRDVQKEVAALVGASPVTVAAPRPAARGKITAETALGKTVAVKFSKTKLKDVIAELESRTKVSFRVDRKSIEAFGLPADPPITFRATGLTLRNVLTYMLADLELDWTVDKGVIVVTSRNLVENKMFTSIDYAVGDLVKGGASGAALVEMIQATVSPTNWDIVGGPASVSFTAVPRPTLTAHTTYRIHEQINDVLAALHVLAGGRQ